MCFFGLVLRSRSQVPADSDLNPECAQSTFDAMLHVVASTDASKYGLLSVLQQHRGNQLKTVAFASRSLTNAERSFHTVENEALECSWASGK